MKTRLLPLALLLLGGCGGGGSDSSDVSVVPTPTPAPAPAPPPAAPAPAPTPAPAPAPTPAPTADLRFDEIYSFRFGQSGIEVPTGCAVSGSPPAVTRHGDGPSLRFLLTPQVWIIGGDVGIGFDGRDADPDLAGREVAYAKRLGPATARFSITRPTPAGAAIDYVRQVDIAAPVGGVERRYRCIAGFATRAEDLGVRASSSLARAVLSGSVLIGGLERRLEANGVQIAYDAPARELSVVLRLVARAADPASADIDLGVMSARATLGTSGLLFTAFDDRAGAAGLISGAFFGPGAGEFGAVFSVSGTASGVAYSATGSLFAEP
ncbi:hypothetical protein GGR88_001803 [Sphingomonas jejuensis]|uniref:Transferrin-binding protein B C-lobe/N-lobe beta barrel domain-containing protein n=1 Tax=Sphingomonas jejuensis TaxID=904715 RepID=A0ABX0XNH4_9SPHN|nr:hypothetical protein [Sphingomonas jejuensis]NJC34329.1 hypothetical protein [Sphingomonas jejuensis]